MSCSALRFPNSVHNTLSSDPSGTFSSSSRSISSPSSSKPLAEAWLPVMLPTARPPTLPPTSWSPVSSSNSFPWSSLSVSVSTLSYELDPSDPTNSKSGASSVNNWPSRVVKPLCLLRGLLHSGTSSNPPAPLSPPSTKSSTQRPQPTRASSGNGGSSCSPPSSRPA